MEMRLKVAGLCLAGFILAAIIVAMALQHNELNRVREENRLLQQQIDEMVARADRLAEENRRLLGLITANRTNPAAPAPPEQLTEILRLRGEVGRLRLVEREAEQSRSARIRDAQLKLPQAEADLVRATQMYSDKVISTESLSQHRFTVELLKAEAKGNMVEAGQVRLRQAEEELARAEDLHRRSLISQTQYELIVRKAEALRAVNQ